MTENVDRIDKNRRQIGAHRSVPISPSYFLYKCIHIYSLITQKQVAFSKNVYTKPSSARTIYTTDCLIYLLMLKSLESSNSLMYKHSYPLLVNNSVPMTALPWGYFPGVNVTIFVFSLSFSRYAPIYRIVISTRWLNGTIVFGWSLAFPCVSH